MQTPESAQAYFSRQTARLKSMLKKRRIVFPEGDDPRVMDAASRLCTEELVLPIIMGKPSQRLAGCVEVGTPADHPKLKDYARFLQEKRRSRGVTLLEAEKSALNPLVFAGLMVASGDADGFVGGAATTTADTFRAAHMT